MFRWLYGLIPVVGILCLTDDVQAQKTAAPNEQSILSKEPESPEAFFDAVVLMTDLGRPILARAYLEKLMALQPDDAAILRMRDKHGAAVFLQLSNDKNLQPESEQLLERMNQAFARVVPDVAEIDALIADLRGPHNRREAAILQLNRSRRVAIPRMLAAVAKKHLDHELAVEALVRMGAVGGGPRAVAGQSLVGSSVIYPLIGALEAPEERVKIVALQVLLLFAARESADWLWHPAFDKDQSAEVRRLARQGLSRIFAAARRRQGNPSNESNATAESDRIPSVGDSQTAAAQLERIARIHFRLDYVWPLTPNSTVEFWRWDATQDTLVMHELTQETASLFAATQFSKQSLLLAPNRRDRQGLFLATRLALDTHLHGPAAPNAGVETPFHAALLAGPDVALETLQHSLQNPRPAVATTALDVLSRTGNRTLLRADTGKVSPILQALNYPHPGVQLAAAVTVLEFDPVRAFRNSSRVVSILSRELTGVGERHAIAIDPNLERASTTKGLLLDMGFETEVERAGRAGFERATKLGHLELIAIHWASEQWDARQTIANLRADARTAGIPIVIYGPPSVEYDVERFLRENEKRFRLQFTMVSFAPDDAPQGIKDTVQKITTRLAAAQPTPEERSQWVRTAVQWLAHIGSGRMTDLFDLRPAEEPLGDIASQQGISVDVRRDALIALAGVPTRTAQERLQSIAIGSEYDVAIRLEAALQVAFHLRKHGLLLSDQHTDELKLAWEQATDPTLKTALAAVVYTYRSGGFTEFLKSHLADPILPPVVEQAP